MSGSQTERSEIQSEIDEEIAFHLEEAVRERVAAGLPEDVARASAVADFGNVGKVRIACQRQRLWRDHMMQRFHMTLTLFLALCTGFFALQWARAHGARQAAVEAQQALISASKAAEVLRPERATRQDLTRYAVGDTLRIVDMVEPDRFHFAQQIRVDGMILMPDIGWVRAEGMTRQALSDELNRAMSPYHVNPPQFEISLEEPSLHRVPPVSSITVAAEDSIRFADPVRPDEWSGEVRVQPDGTCLFPVIGRLQVAGVTRPDLEALVRERMALFYRDGHSEALIDIVKAPR